MILRSEVKLPGCTAASDASAFDLRIRNHSGGAASSDDLVYAWPGRYGLTLLRHPDGWLMSTREHGGMLVTHDLGEIRCFPRGSSDDWTDILLRRVLPRVMQAKGRLLLHAACVSDGDRAHLLLGRSSMGKSTLTAALNLDRSWEVLTDDQAILDPRTEPPLCHPCGSSFCLWPDSAHGLGLPLESMRLVAGHEDKRFHPGTPPSSAQPRPLGSFIFLADHETSSGEALDRIEVRAIPPAEAARYAYSTLMFFNPTDTRARARAWTDLGNVIRNVPSFALAYPREYSVLPDVSAAIATLTGAPAERR